MEYLTKGKIKISRQKEKLQAHDDISFLVENLDAGRGMFLSSGTEYPGRYSRWETGFVAPPVEVIAFSQKVVFTALNSKGENLLEIFYRILSEGQNKMYRLEKNDKQIVASIVFAGGIFTEEQRSKQASILTPIRDLLGALKSKHDSTLGFYGAFGFDLLFQFEKIKFVNKRDASQPIVRLFFPDKIYTYDRKKEEGFCHRYDFCYQDISAERFADKPLVLPKSSSPEISLAQNAKIRSNLSDAQYAALVEKAKQNMQLGDIFELVLSRKYSVPYAKSCAALFRKMIQINPSPYQFFCQFGDEQLIGTSPEMFVRVTQNEVESCPISGTIKRGTNPLEDARQIKQLLNSEKDEVELTMCTDVDRNDKSRVCKPGSIKLLGRRQIERYKGLFHTVDHLVGTLRDDCDGIDAFLSHMWAVTLMGSPKSIAAQLIEEYENEPREYYGGAIGALFCNGDINTGITIRTIHLKDKIAKYSVGASLVYDSVGEEEAKETQLKSASFFNIFNSSAIKKPAKSEKIGSGLKVVVIDNQDSFVNTLADYFRQIGAAVITYRSGTNLEILLSEKPDLILHSPGPKLPKDFGMHEIIEKLAKLNIPQFGVCLGLQGIVETFGGNLRRLEIPHQGKKWQITHSDQNIFENLPNPCQVGAYHSWVADEKSFPSCLEITAQTSQGLIMGIAHKTKPLWAVQFHPESIMSMNSGAGLLLIKNVIRCVKRSKNL